MPHKPNNREEPFQFDDCFSVDVVHRRSSRRRKSVSGMKRPKPASLTTEMAQAPDSVDAIMRTGLLMAALRVWELKQGFRDYW